MPLIDPTAPLAPPEQGQADSLTALLIALDALRGALDRAYRAQDGRLVSKLEVMIQMLAETIDETAGPQLSGRHKVTE